MSPRRCTAKTNDGRPCGATPLTDAPYCFWHSPETAEEAAEARHLGGVRRRREKAVVGAYELIPLDTAWGLRRILEIVVLDTLALENSNERSRVLIAAVNAAVELNRSAISEARYGALDRAVATAHLAQPSRLFEAVANDIP
jgi:hypothetical protein